MIVCVYSTRVCVIGTGVSVIDCLCVQVKVSDVGLMQAVGCGADYYTSLLKSSLKSSIAW